MRKLIAAAVIALSLGLAAKESRAAMTVYEIGTSTPINTAVVIATGSGWADVEISTGAAGDYLVVWDSSATTNVGLALDGTTSAPPAKRIATIPVTATNTSYTLPGNKARYFANGLTVIKSATAVRAIVQIQQ
jgi:hypothetical protein